MPVTKSAAKALRKDRRRQQVNKRVRQKVKVAVDEIRKGKTTKKDLDVVYSVLDRAAKKGIIHKNKAARLKSRLNKLTVKNKAEKPAAAAKPKTTKKKPAAKKTTTKKKVATKKK